MCFTSVIIFCILRLFFLIYNFLYFSCSPFSLPQWINYNDQCLLSLLDTDNSSIQRRKLTQCRIQSKHNYLNFSGFTFIWFVELIRYFLEASGRVCPALISYLGTPWGVRGEAVLSREWPLGHFPPCADFQMPRNQWLPRLSLERTSSREWTSEH